MALSLVGFAWMLKKPANAEMKKKIDEFLRILLIIL